MIVQFIKKNILLCLLIFIIFLLAVTNYQPNTYLSGWDTLHPEFDFNLNLKRIIFGVWREEQGLGAVAAHSHMSELPRIILLWMFHFFLPVSFLRYAYVFLCLFLGPIGVYFFLEKILFKSQTKYVKQTAAFLGSLFYLLNFGTVQNFYVPFEMFPTQFAFIGWILLFTFKFLEEEDKKNLLLFSVFVIFSAPTAYASQLWYAFFLFFLILIFGYSIKKGSPYIKKSILLTLLLILLNSFWLLPNLYYIKNYSTIPKQAKTNRISSEEFFYHNQKSGTIKETALLKNFYYNWGEYNFTTNKNEHLMNEWRNHYQSKSVLFIGYLFFLFVLSGLVLSFFYFKNYSLPLFFVFILNFFAIANNTFLISSIFQLLKSFPLLSEALRFSFNKFSINLTFIYAIYLSIFFGILFDFFGILFELLNKRFNKKTFLAILFIVSIFICYLLFAYTKPAFLGYLIDPQMKIKIPDEYFKLGRWLNNKPDNGRILKLPINTLFGWLYYEWGYQGAGFNWFNIKQSTLDRDFDRWYPYNEQAYREFFYAVYSQNQPLFQKLLSKYNIKYILLDENVIVPGAESRSKKLFYPEIKQLLAKISNIKLTKKFGQKISLFEFLPNKEKEPVEILTNYKIVEPSYRWNYVDEAYKHYGDYITYGQRPSPIGNLIYPARNILTEEEKINQKILSIGKDSYQISFEKSQSLENGEIKIPALFNTESEFYAEVYAKKNTDKIIIELKYLLPYIATDKNYAQQFVFEEKDIKVFSINDKIFNLPSSISEISTYLGEEILYTQKENVLSLYETGKTEILSTRLPLNLSPYLCSTPQENQIFGAQSTADGFKIYGQRAKICLEVPLKELIKAEKDGALKLSFNYQTEKKEKSEFCFFDKDKNKCLDFFIPIGQEKSKTLYLKFSFDTREESEIKQFLIKNINFNFYKKNSQQIFLAEIPQFESTTEEFKLEGKFPQEKINITAENIGNEKKDCGFEKAKFIDKQFIEDGGGTILEYKATDGSICDTIAFPNLSQNMGYILTIESQNINGLPLKICFENDKTKICDLEDRLSKNKTMNTDYFIVPPYSNGYGYKLLLNNLSIGDVPAINRIKDIRVVPFPYNFFQSVRWESENQKTTPLPLPEPGRAGRFIKIDVKQPLPFLYTAKLKSPFPNNSLLVLDQAYEKNWKAYQIRNWLNAYFPFLFSQELKDHVLVNNWANGWRLEESPKSADQSWRKTSQRGLGAKIRRRGNDNTIVIIFFPQYLEFIGFGSMVLGLLWVFFRFKNVSN